MALQSSAKSLMNVLKNQDIIKVIGFCYKAFPKSIKKKTFRCAFQIYFKTILRQIESTGGITKVQILADKCE